MQVGHLLSPGQLRSTSSTGIPATGDPNREPWSDLSIVALDRAFEALEGTPSATASAGQQR
jgi:hypothetical protein